MSERDSRTRASGGSGGCDAAPPSIIEASLVRHPELPAILVAAGFVGLAWRQGQLNSLAHGDKAREHLVTAYIRANVNRLLSTRNSWMFNERKEQTYEGPQSLNNGRETRIRTAEDMLNLLGQYALVSDPEFPLAEALEHGQRIGLMSTHAAGSYEIDKVIISRRIGLSRTKDVAAPTH